VRKCIDVLFDYIEFLFVELRLAMDTLDKDSIAKAFEHFLATGNLNSKTNLGLRQVSFFPDYS
jgi:hypothetical protein